MPDSTRWAILGTATLIENCTSNSDHGKPGRKTTTQTKTEPEKATSKSAQKLATTSNAYQLSMAILVEVQVAGGFPITMDIFSLLVSTR